MAGFRVLGGWSLTQHQAICTMPFGSVLADEGTGQFRLLSVRYRTDKNTSMDDACADLLTEAFAVIARMPAQVPCTITKPRSINVGVPKCLTQNRPFERAHVSLLSR